MNRSTKLDQAEAVERLRGMLKPGETVWCVLRHPSSGGDSWWLDFYTFPGDYKLWFSSLFAKAGVGSFDERRECLKVRGGGMDMCAATVMDVSKLLFGDAYALRYGWV